ncbi:DgyrCDS7553 [Dimorphilus gyrociliatus]|uniref:DgyrCDS7553 n=1 Tax=Dimorphilus gyrociliatus TaxID=2664684 RepID=A0A7I8VRD9_9ANNE|nr:DgyrCDS7553 [Dimorphilus gyrociliatus]
MHQLRRNVFIYLRRHYKYGILLLVNISLLLFNIWILTNTSSVKSSNTKKLSLEVIEHEYYKTLDDYEKGVHLRPQPIYAEEKNEPFEKDKTRIDEVYTQAQHKYKVPLKYDYSERSSYIVPSIEHQGTIKCSRVMKNDEQEINKAESLHIERPGKIPVPLETYQWWLSRCKDFRRARGYVEVATEQEEKWPLAFSLSIYRDFEQAERLLRAIWRPHNIYCIHIDVKSPLIFHRTVRALAKCFDNVFIASHLDKIKWGDVSVLLPDINCMRDLIRYYRGRWKYFINLTGQEFPLRTNYELARIAEIFNGSNDIAGSLSRMEMDRVIHKWGHRWSITYQQMIFYDTFEQKTQFYENVTFYKGEMHGLFSHNFVKYVVESKIGIDYLNWCKDTGHPSEHYYNVLNYNKYLNAPGGYYGMLTIVCLS